jgi:glycosyltransferase involved in cell wall biosynthesis
VTLVSFDDPTSKDFYSFDPNVNRVRLGIGPVHCRSSLFDTVRRTIELRRVVKKIRPDVAIGFMHSAFVPLGIALIGTTIPLLASEHIVFRHYDDRPVEAWLLRLGSLLSKQVTVVSNAVRRTYPPVVAKRMVVVTNPVLVPLGKADPTGGPQKILLSVGRLEKQKDPATLIAAFGLIAAEFPEWRLRLIGEGELRTELAQKITSEGLSDRIELPGSSRSIEHEYIRAQLFAIASSYESFGLVTAEALAHGLPAVGFEDCPGTSELIQDGVNGRFAKGPDRVRAMAEALRVMMGSAELRRVYGRAAPHTVAHYSVKHVVDRWEAILNSLRQRSGV